MEPNNFLAEDVRALSRYKFKIDDDLNPPRENIEFFDLAVRILKKRLEQVDKFHSEHFLDEKILAQDEYVELDPEKLSYVKSIADLKKRWQKQIHYRLLLKCKI